MWTLKTLPSVILAAALLAPVTASAQAQSSPKMTVVASGLNNPRGLTFGENGALYVAEGGTGGNQSTTDAQCLQVPPPVGPYTGGFTGRISKISSDGTRTTVVDGLPSSTTAPARGSEVGGVADVKFVNGRLEALLAGAGCSHGLNGTSNGIIRVHENGSTTLVANLSAFLATHPVLHPDAADFTPDGNWYSMARLGHDLYATEPNHQELDRISSDGHVSRVVDFSKNFPGDTDWQGPTAVVAHGDSLYVGTLTRFPTVAGVAQVFKVNPKTGQFSVFVGGLSAILGLAFDEHGTLYVLESLPIGQVVRIDPGGTPTVIATGLSFPSAMTFGPDGNLYVSNRGFGFPQPSPGEGQVLKIVVNPEAPD
jgi:glucose/arabinose dehydrogenase